MSPMFHSSTDVISIRNDLYSLVAYHPEATFFLRYEGVDNDELSIFTGDILVVDRSLQPTKNTIVVSPDEESFRVCRFESTDVWGVVAYVIHKTI